MLVMLSDAVGDALIAFCVASALRNHPWPNWALFAVASIGSFPMLTFIIARFLTSMR